jgi:redox-sensing transcriptional repressor
MTRSEPQISISTIRRLALYHRTLERAFERQEAGISSEELARRNRVKSVQVRKDLSYFGTFGKRGFGYSVGELKDELKRIIGINRVWSLIVVGIGNVGRALLDYAEAQRLGFRIIAGFDIDPRKVESRHGAIRVLHLDRLEDVVGSEGIDIGVVTVPASSAQDVCDRLIRAGIRAILNFAPMPLQVPSHIPIRNVDMSIELEVLSFFLSHAAADAQEAGQSTHSGRRRSAARPSNASKKPKRLE